MTAETVSPEVVSTSDEGFQVQALTAESRYIPSTIEAVEAVEALIEISHAVRDFLLAGGEFRLVFVPEDDEPVAERSVPKVAAKALTDLRPV